MSGTTMFGGETGVTGGLSSGRSPQSFTSIMSDTPSDASNNPVMPIDGHQVKQIIIQSLTNAFNGLFAPYNTSNPFYFFLEIHLNLGVNSFFRLSSLVTMSSCRALEVAPTLTTVTLWTPCPQSSLQTTTRSQRPSIWTNGQTIYLRHESPFKNELLQLMQHFRTYIQLTKNSFDNKNSPLYSLKTKFSLWYNRICLHISNLSKEYYLYVIRPVLKGKFTSKRIEILKLCTTKYLV